MAYRIVFPAAQQAVVESFDPRPPGPREARVRSICSLMSTGTENIVYNRLFEPGGPWDKWVKYPFAPGYATIGDVEAVGAEVTSVKVGDRVASRAAHASHQVCVADGLAPVPADMPPEEAAWFALAKIASMGARAARYELGDTVLVIGAGPVGQMTVRWAAASGAVAVVAVDTVEARLEMARRGGATATLAKPVDQAAVEILDACGGTKPRVVIDTTGAAPVFAHALAAAGDRGRVVLLGDTGHPAQQRLTSDLILRGLTVVGAHDGLDDAAWDARRAYRLFFSLASRGRFDLGGMTTHRFGPADAAEAYRVANARRDQTMGIVFDWTGA